LHVACAFNRLAKTPDALVEAHASVTHGLLTLLEQQFVDHLPWYTAREVGARRVQGPHNSAPDSPCHCSWYAIPIVIACNPGSAAFCGHRWQMLSGAGGN
jgi:hypothetical protein